MRSEADPACVRAEGAASDADKPAPRRKARPSYSQPAAYMRPWVEILTERGIDPQRLFQGTQLSPAMLDRPDLRVTAAEAARLVGNAIALTGDPGLGLEIGLRSQPTMHGYLGYAVLSCASVREVVELGVRFAHLRQRDVSLSFASEGDPAALEGRDNHAMGAFRATYYEVLMVGAARLLGVLLGEERPDCELWFDWPEPAYYAAYRARLPKTRFSMPANQLRVPAAILGRRPVMADPCAVRQAIEQCEREQALGGGAPACLSQRVRAQLSPGPGGYPDLEATAAALCMSASTLKRRLGEAGTSYQQLLNEQRRRDALHLIGRPEVTIQRIAELLGYQDPPSFTRAFLRWCGKSPSQARRELQQAGLGG